jgi:hypothetical protein
MLANFLKLEQRAGRKLIEKLLLKRIRKTRGEKGTKDNKGEEVGKRSRKNS